MAPSCLSIGLLMIVIVRAHTDYVVRCEDLLDNPHKGCLCFFLWEIVGDKCYANLEIRWVIGITILGDTNSKLLVIVGEFIFEYDVICFFRSEGKECKVLVQL